VSTLVVVRHGQASFLADDYDKLSAVGETQARLLGEYWASRGVQFDRVFSGPRVRQVRTALLTAEVAGLPEPTVREEFDEYPAEPVMRTGAPILMERHAHVKEMVDAFYAAGEVEAKRRVFDKLLREVSLRWLEGEVAVEGSPTWHEFLARIEKGIDCIRSEAGRASRVVLFTSAGPMAATARIALDLAPRAAMELTWSPRNAAFSEFLFTEERFSLSTFNETPHLGQDATLLTYR
jgi:broad specificity phosphatase PhoE